VIAERLLAAALRRRLRSPAAVVARARDRSRSPTPFEAAQMHFEAARYNERTSGSPRAGGLRHHEAARIALRCMAGTRCMALDFDCAPHAERWQLLWVPFGTTATAVAAQRDHAPGRARRLRPIADRQRRRPRARTAGRVAARRGQRADPAWPHPGLDTRFR
jgi:hypothetical protein